MSVIDYKVPKVNVNVDVLINEEAGTPMECLLFLNEFSRYRKGKETILEFLNKENYFIPLKVADTGKFIIVSTNELVYVKEQDESKPPPSPKRLVLHMVNNIRLEVDFFKLLPESQSRVLDYLNDKSQFIVFYHENRKIYVNKHKIRRLEEK